MRVEEATLTSPCLLTDKVAEAQQECLCLPHAPHRAAGLGAGQWEGSSDRNWVCASPSLGALGSGRAGGSPDLCSSPGCRLPVGDCVSSPPGDFSCAKWGWAQRTTAPQDTCRNGHSATAGLQGLDQRDSSSDSAPALGHRLSHSQPLSGTVLRWPAHLCSCRLA